MAEDLLNFALAAAWLFGALALWPIARFIGARQPSTYRVLFWLFVAQIGTYLVWGTWLTILWLAGASHVYEGLIILYILGAVFWVASLAMFVDWYIGHRRALKGERAT